MFNKPRQKWIVISCAGQQLANLAKDIENMSMGLAFMPDDSKDAPPLQGILQVYYEVFQKVNENLVYSMTTDDPDTVIAEKHEAMHTETDAMLATAKQKEDQRAGRNPFAGLDLESLFKG